jgi:starch synthase
MRYGTVPVARATGGLDDTVSDHAPDQPGVGFKFKDYETQAMLDALSRALIAYQNKAEWEGIMRRAMALDFSWERAAFEYENIYERARRLHLGQ